jgi:hypothetical protein
MLQLHTLDFLVQLSALERRYSQPDPQDEFGYCLVLSPLTGQRYDRVFCGRQE